MIRRSVLTACFLAAGTARAGILAGYDFDADSANPGNATVTAAQVTAGPLTSPMTIDFTAAAGDDSGVDADGEPFGSTNTLGTVGIQVTDAVGASFANALAGNDYLAFTVAPEAGFKLHLSSLSFKAAKRASTSVDEYAVTDADGTLIGSAAVITNVIGLTGSYDGVTVDLSDARFQHVSEPTEFRIFAWGRGTTATSGTLAVLDKVVLKGRAESTILVGYDFDGGSAEAVVTASNVIAGALTSPMAVEFTAGIGDTTGVDAFGADLGSTHTLGAVGIGVDDAASSSFADALAGEEYLSFTVTPDRAALRLSAVTFKAGLQADTAVNEFAVTDGAGNMLGSAVIVTNASGLTGSYEGVSIGFSTQITEAAEFRIYAWGRGAGSTSGTLTAVDKITLHGTAVALGGDYVVSTTGSDSNPGTLEAPFATLQHAVDQLGPGSTLTIRGGTYRQSIDLAGLAGTTDFPITLTAYEGETVTLDGTTAVSGSWTLDEGNVYRTTVSEDVTQLFVDGELMTLARHPNALVFSETCWGGGRLAQDAGSANGTVIDAALAETGISYNGCVAILNFGAHATGARLVENHAAGSDTFNYTQLDKYKTSSGYFFEGGLHNAGRILLDTEQEWAYDESTQTLYLWADDGLNPEGRQIFSKGTNAYAVVGGADTQHVVIDGIDFFAAGFYFKSSDHITVRNCGFDYYVASARSLGCIEPPAAPYFGGADTDFCRNVTVYNCTFRNADGGGLWVEYAENPRVENCLFKDIDYACVDPSDITADSDLFNLTKGTVPMRKSRDIVFRRNTIDRAGSGQGVAVSLFDASEGRPCLLEYNYVSGCARRESDGAAYQVPTEAATHSTIRYNWFIGNYQRDVRWDGPDGGPLGNLYRNVALARNGKVIAASGDGFCCKGNQHEIYNNSGIYQQCEMWTPGNADSVIRNNAVDNLIPDPLPGSSSHNCGDFSMLYLLRDPDNFDFRPRAGYTNLIDQGTNVTCDINGETVDVTAGYLGDAPDIGAYEYGASAYWIPGRQEAQASVPVPRDGAAYARLDADLMYLIGLGGASADIYFGTSSNALTFLTRKTDPENIVTLSDYTALDDNTTYYWRVDTVLDDGSVVTGEVWSFTTMLSREFLPWSVRSLGNAVWKQNALSGNLVYDNYDTLYSRRALVYSTNAYQSAGGFRLTVGYTAGSVDSSLSHNFSFGLISTDTDPAAYSGYNPFRVQTDVYSLGVNIVANGDGSMQGLNFADGSSVTNLDRSGDYVQFGTLEKFETMESNIVVIEIRPDGAWTYSINGIAEASGVIANGFDLTKSYRAAAYGQDDNGGGKALQHISLELLPEYETYAAWIAGCGLTGADALPGADPENGGAGDGYDNFAEYALGMDPTVSDAGSRDWADVWSADGTNWFDYVHYRRSDYAELGLTYLLIDSTNLLDAAAASTNTQDEVLTGPSAGGWVTNRYKIEEPVKLIELRIRQD